MMAPKKRKPSDTTSQGLVQPRGSETLKKRLTKTQIEENICRKKLRILEEQESLSTNDRFTLAERKSLLEAYNRKESDLKGLMHRLKMGLQQEPSEVEEDNLEDWQKLCQKMMSNLARDKRLNLDNAMADALFMAAENLKLNEQTIPQKDVDESEESNKPNYPQLLEGFAQLLMGKFPNNMTAANAKISLNLFDHITSLVDSMDLDKINQLIVSGSWLESTSNERRKRQEIALKGLEELDKHGKKCPSLKDIEERKNIEALCLELPKVKRITEMLNPLNFNESLVSCLIDLG